MQCDYAYKIPHFVLRRGLSASLGKGHLGSEWDTTGLEAVSRCFLPVLSVVHTSRTTLRRQRVSGVSPHWGDETPRCLKISLE